MKNIESRDAVFALAYDGHAEPVMSDVVALSWTSEVIEVLRQIRKEANDRERERDDEAYLNLPYGGLRARILLLEHRWGSLQDHVGLRYLPEGTDTPRPWGYLCNADSASAKVALQQAFSQWVEGSLQSYSDHRRAFLPGIARLLELQRLDRVLRLQAARVQLFPWPSNRPVQGGPTQFDVSAGFLASRLAGLEIFPELGPVVRIVGGPDANHAELMTRPAFLEGGRYSLVCAISIETLPGGNQPLVFLQFKRRRWANSMASRPASQSIGGFVMPHAARPEAAFRFALSRRNGVWETDLDYRHFEQTLGLSEGFTNERVLQYPCDDHASVLVMVKAEVTEASKSELNAGVPLVDQADAFARIAQVLSEIGLRPFDDYRAVDVPKVTADRLSMLKAEVTLSRLLERYEEDDDDEGTGVGNAPMDVRATGLRIEAATGAPLTRWFKAEPKLDSDRSTVNAIRTLVADTAYASDLRRRVIHLVTDTPEDVKWIKTIAQAILGDAIKVVSMPLPAETHGSKLQLPESSAKKPARFAARLKTWETFVSAQNIPPGSMILVQAAQYYTDGEGKLKRDDNVNKFAARKALAAAGCTVQYLLPSQEGRVDRFIPRVQAALLDLVFGHGGLVWGLRFAGQKLFKDEATRPNWVAGIGSLQVQTEWFKTATVLVATRIECATGKAWVRFGHQEADLALSPWMRFDEGATYVALRRLDLPRKVDARRAAFARFAIETLSDIHQLDPNAVVFIDSTRTATLGGHWLTDRSINGRSLEIASGVFAHERWPGLRLLRVRSQAPSMGQEKIHMNLMAERQPVRTWTITPKLFQVEGTPTPTFWSLARPTNHPKRGASCYRTIVLPNSKITEEHPGPVRAFPPRAKDQHANPRAIEVVVLQRQAGDDPVQLAAFAQSLRAGMLTALNERWVSSPSPLQIIGALAQYMRA